MGTAISIEIPGEVLHAARMTPDDIRRELAILLFQQGRLSFGKAREMTQMTAWAFQLALGSRAMPVHYGLREYEEDLKTLRNSASHDCCEQHLPPYA